MKLRTLFLILFLAVVATFVALNWGAIAAVVPLSVGFTTVYAPLGVLLIGLTVVLVVPLLAYVAFLQRSASTAAARHAEKLEAQRELAERAETSRFIQLREFLADELRKRAGRDEQLRTDVMERLNQLERGLQAAIARREIAGEHDEPRSSPGVPTTDHELETSSDDDREQRLIRQDG